MAALPSRKRLRSNASKVRAVGIRSGEPFVGISCKPIDEQTDPFMDGHVDPP